MKHSRKVKKIINIFCEDKKSSKLYFTSFNSDEEFRRNSKNSIRINVYNPSNSPEKLVKEAIKFKANDTYKEKDDEYWVVFDKDKHKNIPQAYSLAKKKNINIAISIICFEFWILLHFEQTTKPFNNCDALIKYIKSNHFSNYEKCSNCFDALRDNIFDAIRNAKSVEKSVQVEINRGTKIFNLSAYTNVHHLVSKLIPKI